MFGLKKILDLIKSLDKTGELRIPADLVIQKDGSKILLALEIETKNLPQEKP